MGAQQVLRTAACLALIASTASARPRERVAVIDLGGDDGAVRRKLAAAIVAGGLEPVIGDGVEDALAGVSTDRDAIQLAAAIDEARRMFGELKCKEATTAAELAIAIAAGRQAAGIAAPELARAWTYVLLCADRASDPDAAMQAAAQLRALGGSPDVDASVLARYPEIDAVSDRELVAIDIEAAAPGAAVWVDFQPAGVSPLHLTLPAGPHVIAAASGSRRGSVTGTVVKTQPVVAIPMPDQAGAWSKLAARVASWHGKLPKPDELAAVFAEIHARVALVRHADVVEVWGQIGPSEQPHRLGNDDGLRSVAEVDRAVALVVDRVQGWNDHSPDPDQPLLVEDIHARAHKLLGGKEESTKWWVYAAIGAAVLAGAIVIYAHDSTSDTQRVELHYP